MPRKTFVAGDVLTAADMNLLAQDGYVTNSSLDTTAGDLGGAWTTWTPSYTNLTVGNGTTVARYTQIGKTVHYVWSFTWGTTTSASGVVRFTLPVTAQANHPLFAWGVYVDVSAGANYFGSPLKVSTTTVELLANLDTGGAQVLSGVNATSPATWASTDIWRVVGTYEAA